MNRILGGGNYRRLKSYDKKYRKRKTHFFMAANMIGVNKSIIVVAAGPFQFAMVNPVITKKSGEYKTEEGCLSLDGVRPCIRYEEIEVDYLDSNFKPQHGKYIGFTAQIIQHEVDHCNGVVI